MPTNQATPTLILRGTVIVQNIMINATQSGRKADTESGSGIIVNISARIIVNRTGTFRAAR
jgi:hypothetical protein